MAEPTPTTPGGLWDLIAHELGVGSGPRPGEAPHTWRARQVSLLRRQLTRRQLSVAEVADTVSWMKRHGKWATTTEQVFRLVPQARRELGRPGGDEGFEQAYAAAIAIERLNPDSRTYVRLLRATGTHRREVYAQWRASRHSTTKP